MSTIWALDHIETKHTLYRGKGIAIAIFVEEVFLKNFRKV